MFRHRPLILLALLVVLGSFGAAWAIDPPGSQWTVPQPSVAPTLCPYKGASLYADVTGCLYACVNGTRVILAAPGNAQGGCSQASPAPSMTPNPTVTPTPTI